MNHDQHVRMYEEKDLADQQEAALAFEVYNECRHLEGKPEYQDACNKTLNELLISIKLGAAA